MCYTSPDGDSSATYEPIPYATTQLIQANIKNKAAAAGAIAEPLDIPCWKQQPPNLPPIPKEMAAQMQYNISEQSILIKGKPGFHLEKVHRRNYRRKKSLTSLSADNLQGSEGAIHPKPVPYNHNRDHNTGSSYHSSDRGSNSTAGTSSRASSSTFEQWCTALWWPWCVLIYQGVKIKRRERGPPKSPNIMQRPGEKRYLLFMQTCVSVMSTACPWSEGIETHTSSDI